MANELTPAFGALALAAVFSAEASAADAVLLMLATSGSRDLYRRFRPQATDVDLLRGARVSAIAGAVLGLGLAMMHRSVIDALGTFYAVMVVTLFVRLSPASTRPRRRGDRASRRSSACQFSRSSTSPPVALDLARSRRSSPGCSPARLAMLQRGQRKS